MRINADPVRFFSAAFISRASFLASVLLASQHFIDYSREYYNQANVDGTFDFIIVGGGSSGGLLANRLVTAGFSVVILEAGGEPSPFLDIPGFFTSFQNSKYNNYKYYTLPQENNHYGFKKQESYWPHGKGLGGTSNFDALIWTKGHSEDYNLWANLTGDDGWKMDNLEPFFNRTLENIHVDVKPTPMGKVLLRGAEELGYPTVDDNRPYGSSGFAHMAHNRRDEGVKSVVYKELLRPVMNDPNLTILKFATVSKVLFNDDNEAIGVEYIRFNEKKTVKASKEVLLTAGAIESPKLLMLSGIGPREHLENFEIPVRLDLPVGKNLQDHIFILVCAVNIEDPITENVSEEISLASVLNYFVNGKGIFSTTGYAALGFVTSETAKSRGENWPDLQFVLSGSLSDKNVAGVAEERCNVKPGFYANACSDSFGKYSFILIPQVTRALSRGEITLRSTNPMEPPILQPNYFQHEDDMKAIIEAFQISTRLINETKAFRAVGAKLPDRHMTGCEHFEMFTPEYYECYARTMGMSGAHPSGTCRMGKIDDKESVVDSKLRVLGTKRLRVADASIFPVLPNANIFWACLMVAEKAADFIINDYL